MCICTPQAGKNFSLYPGHTVTIISGRPKNLQCTLDRCRGVTGHTSNPFMCGLYCGAIGHHLIDQTNLLGLLSPKA
jgi:hypothetical protein